MRNRTVLVMACLVAVGVAVLAGTALASSTTLELEAADDSDTDSDTVSFTFTTDENATTADVLDTSHSSGGVTFEFQEWEEVGGFDSGTSRSFDVDGETTYRVVYGVEAESSASEGTEFFDPTVEVSYDDGTTDPVTGSLSATVNILEPEFGTIADESVDVTFTPDDGSTFTRTASLDVPNDGDGFMDVEDVSISGEPSFVSADVDSTSDEIDAFSTGSADINIEVDDSISEGTHSFTVTVTDSLGNSESTTVTLDVTKPPAAGAADSTVDFGEILVGENDTAEFTLTERNEFESIAGLNTSIVSFPVQSSISFPDVGSQSISTGGSTTQTVEVSVDDDADQGEQLEWQVYFSPQDQDGISTDSPVTFTAQVIYPPYYDEVSIEESDIVFDEPRDETDVFTETVAVDVTNGGDLPMELTDVSASVRDNQDIEVDVVDIPSSIAPRTEETVTLEVAASSESVEGEWDLDVELTAEEPTTAPGEPTGTVTDESSVSVEHETELRVDPPLLDAGEVIVTEQTTHEATVSERLGYQPIEEFSIDQVSGPEEEWLTVVEQPEQLDAGEEQPFSVSIEFDTTATLYDTYVWEFEKTGANVETEVVTVEAVPEPVDFGETVDELESIGADVDGDAEVVALEMADTLVELEEMLQAGDGTADRDDITVLVTAGSSAILLLDAANEAQSLIDSGEHDEAQEHLVRASAAFNTLRLAAEDVTSPALQSNTEEIRDSADAVLSEFIEQQESHFLEQLEGEDTTELEAAQTQRELARLAQLSGDDDRAADFSTGASEAFDSYAELISGGNEDLLAARELDDELDDELFMSPGGLRLFWIGDLSTYNSESDEVLDRYDSAIEQFEDAGATERAELAAGERAEVESSYGTAYLASLVVGVALALLLFGFIVWEIRALYRYRQDSEAAVSGDFLLPWAEAG